MAVFFMLHWHEACWVNIWFPQKLKLASSVLLSEVDHWVSLAHPCWLRKKTLAKPGTAVEGYIGIQLQSQTRGIRSLWFQYILVRHWGVLAMLATLREVSPRQPSSTGFCWVALTAKGSLPKICRNQTSSHEEKLGAFQVNRKLRWNPVIPVNRGGKKWSHDNKGLWTSLD